MDNKLPSLVADYCSCMEKFFRYIRNLSPVKKSLHTLHLNLYSLLARFRDNVSYLYVVFQHAMNQTTFELYHFLVNRLEHKIIIIDLSVNVMPTMLCTRNSFVENTTTFTFILSSVIACRTRCCLQRCVRQHLVGTD